MLLTHTVQIAGCPVSYAVAGRGQPLVLIHGLAGSWRWWRRNVAAFSQHYSLYLVDLPGFGSMRQFGDRFSLAAAPEWISQLLLSIHVERASILGHSMGGAIAMAFAARWPERVDRLILAAPAVALKHKTILDTAVPLLAAAGTVDLRFYPTLLWDTLRAGPGTVFRVGRTLLAMNWAADMGKVQSPTLLVWGRNDTLVPAKGGDLLRSALPSSRLHVIERAGHVVMFDRPAEFNDVVLRFLSGKRVGE